MLIPLGTDAPVDHWPCATVGRMAACVAATIAGWFLGPDQPEPWMLAYSAGLHPLQWLMFHLGGNLLYLWIFGLVVEGKVGWLAFLGMVLGLGVAEGAIVQVLMLGIAPGQHALGASGILYGLMALAWPSCQAARPSKPWPALRSCCACPTVGGRSNPTG